MKSSRILSCGGVVFAVLALIATLWTGGCGDFLTEKSAGKESNNILDDLGRVQTTIEPNVPMPSIYKQPPTIVEQVVAGAKEFKLFYFCQNLTAAELEAIVHNQFATLVFNQKGQSTAVKDYTVSSVAATNQLIVRCPTREDVESVLELLQQVDIPPIQVKISCLISEVYADKTLDWETTILIEQLLGEQFWAGPGGRPFGGSVMQLLDELSTEAGTLPAFPGASLREVARSKMGLQMGYWKDSKYMALVDILESQGYLKILMNPTLEVVNGKKAKVSSSQRVPVDKMYLYSSQQNFYEYKTEWADVVDSLEITPHVFADGYIGLETAIIVGSKLTPEGIKQLPIVTKKEIDNKENRIRPGESLVIGGLRKSEKRDVLRGLPFLKDIPILGILFSGRDFEERAVETIFILTPTFSTGGSPRQEMVKEVEKKQDHPSSGGAKDPFDILDGKRKKDHEAREAEQARMEADAKKAEARAVVRDAEEQVAKAKADAEKSSLAERKARSEAEKAISDANALSQKAATAEQQAKTEASQAKNEAAQAKTETAQAKAEAQAAAEKTAAAVQQAQTQIEKLKAEAEKLKAETEKAKADLEKATAEAEKAKAEAQKAIAEAEKAKAEAEKAKAEAEAKEKQEVAEESKKETEQAKSETPEQESEPKEQG